MELQRDLIMHFPSEAPTHFKGCQPIPRAKVNSCSESISHPPPKFYIFKPGKAKAIWACAWLQQMSRAGLPWRESLQGPRNDWQAVSCLYCSTQDCCLTSTLLGIVPTRSAPCPTLQLSQLFCGGGFQASSTESHERWRRHCQCVVSPWPGEQQSGYLDVWRH